MAQRCARGITQLEAQAVTGPVWPLRESDYGRPDPVLDRDPGPPLRAIRRASKAILSPYFPGAGAAALRRRCKVWYKGPASNSKGQEQLAVTRKWTKFCQ